MIQDSRFRIQDLENFWKRRDLRFKVNITLVFLMMIFLLSSVGCKEEEEQPVLSEEKMIEVLTDLHIAEAGILSLSKNLKDSMAAIYYNQVFEIHEVKEADFFHDLELLRKSPKRLESTYGKVIVAIEKLEVKKSKANDKVKNDEGSEASKKELESSPKKKK